jgi:ligand-binding SRPBCC domain-containing protein
LKNCGWSRRQKTGGVPPSALAGVGSEIVISFRVHPFLPVRVSWIARITEFEWNHHFVDVQVKGPFPRWHHRHEMQPSMQSGVAGTILRDQIECELGFGGVGFRALQLFASAQIADIFSYRQEVLPRLLGS